MPKDRKTSDPGNVVYQLKVTLLESHLPIWRRFQVESATTLERLHGILQVVMGWTDDHLHGFRLPQPGRKSPRRRFVPLETAEEKTTRLADVVRRPKDWVLYEYDFGDSWEHEITLEEVVLGSPTARYPMVVDGRGACPPEDVGGVSGYYHFLEVINDPQHRDHEEMVEWCGPGFDPAAFDVDAVNRAFHGGRGRRRPDA